VLKGDAEQPVKGGLAASDLCRMAKDEQVVLKILTGTVKQDTPGPEAKALLEAKELQVQLTCGDFNTETLWKTTGSNFLYEKELSLAESELDFIILGRGGAQGSMEAPVARALEDRDGKLTECDKDTDDKMDAQGRRKSIKFVELKLVPLGATTPVLGTLVIFLNAPKGSQPPPIASAAAQPTSASGCGTSGASVSGGGAGGGAQLLQAVPEAGFMAAAQAADEAADELLRPQPAAAAAADEQSLPELSNLFAELRKLRSELKREQRILDNREHECVEAEEELDNARQQVLEKTVDLEDVNMQRLTAVAEDRRRMRMALLQEEQLQVRAELEETHTSLAQAQEELEEVREHGKKVLANVIAQQEGLITRHRVKAFVRKLGADVTGRDLDELFTAQEHGARPAPMPWKSA